MDFPHLTQECSHPLSNSLFPWLRISLREKSRLLDVIMLLTLERYNARLVAKGFNHRYGVHFNETLSPIEKMTTIHCLLAVAAHHHWSINQLDVNNAFLHGDLHKEFFMKVPKDVPSNGQQVCRLHK